MKSSLSALNYSRSVSFCLGLLLTLASGLAVANPVGGEVVAGSGRIVQTSGSRLDVVQGSDRLGINWQAFSIGRGEQVNFDQPSSSSVVLNRVTGPEASHIEGMLTANGQVFLVNRNGVFFHKGSVVDVGGFLATTSDISNGDFLSGRYRFNERVNPSGRIVNEGRITAAEGGLVALVAPSVRNSGVIEARLGRVVLGSGSVYTLDLFGDDLVTFAVDDRVAQRLTGLDGEGVDALVDQSGVIDAPGGRVLLTAGAAGAVVDSVINLSGVVQAKSVSGRGGEIVLHGGDEGLVRVAGTLNASGDHGGQVEVLGGEIELASAARIDASGTGGGGEIYIGGDYQGKGTRQKASRTNIAPGAVVRADATDSGDGGTVIVWSDERTVVDGALSAQGGPGGGDGGLVETSSAGELEFSRSVRVSAPRGEAGTWLLDPEDIEIDRGKADSIEDTLNDGGNVSIKTSDSGDGDGNIYVNASITKTEGDDASLSMSAHGQIDVNKPIRSEQGELDVSLKAGREVNVNADIDTNGGRFSTRITGVPDEPKDEPEVVEEPEEVEEPEVAEDAPESKSDEQGAEVADTEGWEGPEDDGSVLVELGEGGPEEEFMESPGELVVELSDGEEVKVEVGPGEGQEVTDKVEEVAGGIESVSHVTSTGSGTNEATQSQMPLITVTESSVTTKGGDISVDAGAAGGVFITGNLDSSDMAPEGVGGDIEVLGQHIVIAGDASIDSSGDEGGGDIHIGGDYQGKGERRRSESTTIGKRVVIRSDATGNGDAGDVVIWSDGTTRYQGTISARGGPEGGDGGRVEVSGKKNLGYWGEVDASAANGNPGSLLLDPTTLRIIDATRGDADHDLNVFCDGSSQRCYFPATQFLLPPGADPDPQKLTAQQFAELGIDPDPETDLNTLTWDRLIQMAGITGFGINLQAENDVTIAAFTGVVSTRGSPSGSEDGLTITLSLSDPVNERCNATGLVVTSSHGDILFEDQSNNLAVRGGSMEFYAPEGDLKLGNLYGLGPDERIPADVPTSWRYGFIRLQAGGSIETGTINTRNQPARFSDPVTGAPIPQELIISDTSTFDTARLLDSPALQSDFDRGGPIRIQAGGNIDIFGPVYTGTGKFVAEAGGTFRARYIDTGANRLIVKSSESDPGSLNTLNTGIVEIKADKITFDKINAGEVTLEADTHELAAISGEVEFDTFRNSDFIGSRPESEGIPFLKDNLAGLTITVGDDVVGTCTGNCIDNLLFNLGDLGEAEIRGLGSGDQLIAAQTQLGLSGTVLKDLGRVFTYIGGDIAAETRHVPQQSNLFGLRGVCAPVVVPVDVPLDPPSAPGPRAAASISLEIRSSAIGPVVSEGPSPVSAGMDGGAPLPPAGDTEIGPLSSADVQRIKDEGKEERAMQESGSCADEDRFEWLERGPRSAARDLDFGRRSGIGADPEDTDDVFKIDNCYFTHTVELTNVNDDR